MTNYSPKTSGSIDNCPWKLMTERDLIKTQFVYFFLCNALCFELFSQHFPVRAVNNNNRQQQWSMMALGGLQDTSRVHAKGSEWGGGTPGPWAEIEASGEYATKCFATEMPSYHAKSHCQINEPWPKQMGGDKGAGNDGEWGARNVGSQKVNGIGRSAVRHVTQRQSMTKCWFFISRNARKWQEEKDGPRTELNENWQKGYWHCCFHAPRSMLHVPNSTAQNSLSLSTFLSRLIRSLQKFVDLQANRRRKNSKWKMIWKREIMETKVP